MPKTPKDVSYQELSNQLDELVAKLQDPNVGIDEAVELFERALKLTQQLEDHLQKAENRVIELKAQFTKKDT